MKQGKLADASHHAMLYTSEALAGPLSFGKFATTLKSALIKAGQGQASKGFEKGLAEAEAKRKGTGMGWHLQGFQPVHSQGDYYISISAMMEDGTGNSMATTMNLVLAKSHLINLVTYENHVTEESKAIKASREASAAWVSSVLAANPVSAAEQERDRASLLESNFSFKMDYAVGLVVGFLLMLGAFWPLKRLGRKA